MHKPMSCKDRRSRMRTLWGFQGGRCCHCWEPVVHPDDKKTRAWLDLKMQPSIEHVVPKGRGGSNKLENLMLAHVKCNQKRGLKQLRPGARKMLEIVRAAVRNLREREAA